MTGPMRNDLRFSKAWSLPCWSCLAIALNCSVALSAQASDSTSSPSPSHTYTQIYKPLVGDFGPWWINKPNALRQDYVPDCLPNLRIAAPQQATSTLGVQERPLKTTWNVWQDRIQCLICQRFNAKLPKGLKNSPLVSCRASYNVSPDVKIENVLLIKQSHTPIFDSLVLNTIKSLKGNPALVFPPGPKPKSVEMSGVFALKLGRFRIFGQAPVSTFDPYPEDLPKIEQKPEPSPNSEAQHEQSKFSE